MVLNIVLWSTMTVELLGWIVPLLVGMRRRRQGSDGSALIRAGRIWGWLALALFGVVAYSIRALSDSEPAFPLWVTIIRWAAILGVTVPLFLGWLVPLVAGIRRRRREGGGGKLISIGATWAILIAALGGSIVYSLNQPFKPVEIVDFDPATCPADQLGTLTVGWTGACSVVVYPEGGGGLRLAGAGGTLSAPPGTYNIPMGLELHGADATGDLWTATIYGESWTSIQVKAGESTALAGGPPFTAAVAVGRTSGRKASFDLKVRDVAGNSVIVQKDAYPSRKKPEFEVLAPDGGVVWRGNFEYG